MKILFIASGFAPYSFSENIVNSKLVLAFLSEGWEVDVISRKDEGTAYSQEWDDEWKPLRGITHESQTQACSPLGRIADVAKQSLFFGYPLEGVRWARRAYEWALSLHAERRFDVVMSRSPADSSHMVAEKFSRKTGVAWIANWNDPARSIWPPPYTENMSVLSRKLHSAYVGKMIERAAIATFPCAELREHFAAFFPELNGQRSEIIPHIAMDRLPGALYEDCDTFRILHAGNLSQERNPARFFVALARFRNNRPNAKIRLDLMGPCDERVTALMRKFGLEGCVRSIGSYPYGKSLEIMATYDVLLLIEADVRPCIFLPSKLADYAGSGVPVFALSPDESCVSRMIERLGGGCAVDCNDEEKMLAQLHSFYRSWEEGRLRKDFNGEVLYSYFAPAKILAMYKQVFSQLS